MKGNPTNIDQKKMLVLRKMVNGTELFIIFAY